MGDLECSGACLLGRLRVYDQDTRAASPRSVLLLWEPPVVGSPAGSPLLRVRTPAVSFPPLIRYV